MENDNAGRRTSPAGASGVEGVPNVFSPEGARFEVRLPRLSGAGTPVGSSQAIAADDLRAEGTKVMVADDYAAIRDSLEMRLTMKGFVVETAADGQALLSRIGAFKPDVVVADLRMPSLSGNEIARKIRVLPDGAGIRLLAMSGHASALDRKQALEAGSDELLVKPVASARLIELLTAPRPSGHAVA